jgi:prefoldin subunit 5
MDSWVLLGVAFVFAVMVALNWESISQKWFTPSLQERLVEIDEEYQSLVNADQAIRNFESDIVNLESKIVEIGQGVQERQERVNRFRALVDGKGLTESIVIDSKNYVVRNLIREIHIIGANIDYLNFKIQDLNQEKITLVERLRILNENYSQQSREYVQGIQTSSHLGVSGNLGENQELAEAVMKDASVSDPCSD